MVRANCFDKDVLEAGQSFGKIHDTAVLIVMAMMAGQSEGAASKTKRWMDSSDDDELTGVWAGGAGGGEAVSPTQ